MPASAVAEVDSPVAVVTPAEVAVDSPVVADAGAAVVVIANPHQQKIKG
jgi:hypothetical protein